MGIRFDKQCRVCKKWEIEVFDDDDINWGQCSSCNDRQADQERARREWEYYHPTE